MDLDDPEEVWNRLTAKEKENFQELVESGEIMGCVPPDDQNMEDDNQLEKFNIKLLSVKKKSSLHNNFVILILYFALKSCRIKNSLHP